MIYVKDESFQYFMNAYKTIMDYQANTFDAEHLEHLKGVMWAALFNEFRTEDTDKMACCGMRRVDDILTNRQVDSMILGE